MLWGVELTELSEEQAEYINVAQNVPSNLTLIDTKLDVCLIKIEYHDHQNIIYNFSSDTKRNNFF